MLAAGGGGAPTAAAAEAQSVVTAGSTLRQRTLLISWRSVSILEGLLMMSCSAVTTLHCQKPLDKLTAPCPLASRLKLKRICNWFGSFSALARATLGSRLGSSTNSLRVLTSPIHALIESATICWGRRIGGLPGWYRAMPGRRMPELH